LLQLTQDCETAIDAALDADDETLHRMWRYRALGATLGQLAYVPPNGKASVQLKGEDFRLVRAAAVDKGLSVHAYLRTCIARCLIADYGLEPPDIPSLARDLGAWTDG
jgi:hypothetical protein